MHSLSIDGRSPLVAVHFPKSAGTSLRYALAGLLGERLVIDYARDPLSPRRDEVVERLPEGAVAVYGHFRPSAYPLENARRVTVLRDPIENLVSIYVYWKMIEPHDNPIHDRFRAEQPDILAFAEYAGLQRLMSDTYFGGYDMACFDFIGTHDNPSHTRAGLSAVIGADIGVVPHVNPTPDPREERREILSDQACLGRLSELLRADIQFYEKIKRDRRLA